MTQNILEIQVSQLAQETEEILSAGNMYEHNATALQFMLDAVYLHSDYRYYAEFVTVKGVARTEYLMPNEAGVILVSLPQEITAQMTAMCVFNIVQIGDSGKTEQLIKAKKVRLYFSDLENTEKLLDADYAFSVNALLEAIYNDTFKGDKGDKGDAYILTEADKTEIARQVDQVFYGLPMQMHMTVRQESTLSAATDRALVSTLLVRPDEAAMDGISDIQVAIGKNILADMLDSAKYSTFSAPVNNYTQIPITVTPGVEYVVAKLSANMAKTAYSYLKTADTTVWLCHKSNASLNGKYGVFTGPEDGQCSLYSTAVYSSQWNYQQVLDTDWVGLTVMEKENSVLLQKTFSQPLYAVSKEIGDSYDFISGTLTRRTAKAMLTSAQLVSDETAMLTDTVYRYKLTLPEDSPARRYGCTEGICTALPTMKVNVSTASDFADYQIETGYSEGIWFGSYDENVYILSVLEPENFAAWLDTESVEILYATAERAEPGEATAVQLPFAEKNMCVTPNQLRAEVWFSADISAVANDFESRLSALENTI